MSLRTYNLSLTIANTLNPDENEMATNNPLGCIEIAIGSYVKFCEINPFF